MPTRLNPFLLLYLIFTLAAFLVSPVPQHSLPYLVQAAVGVGGFWLTYAWLNQPHRLTQLLWGLVLLGGGIAFAGLFLVEWPAQYLFDLRPLLAYLPAFSTSFTIHPNAMAGALLLPLVVAIAVWRGELAGWQRVALATAVVFMALMLLLTQSRNAWLALLVAGVVVALWGRGRFAYFALGLGLMAAFTLVLPLLSSSALLQPLGQRVAIVDDLTKSGTTDEPSWLSRVEIWQVAGQTVRDYPVWGAGLYAFEPVSRANYVYTLVTPRTQFAHAHNLVWHTAVNLGLIGAMTVIALWGVVLWGLWQGERRSDTAVLGAAFVAYLCFNLFDVVAWEMKAGLFTWLYLAVALRLSPPPAPAGHKATIAVGMVLGVWILLFLTPLGQQNRVRGQLDQSRFAQQEPLAGLEPMAFGDDVRRMGLLYVARGEVDTAVAVWQADAQAVPFLRQQGMVAYLEGAWDTAVGWYKLALQIDESDGLTHYWLGLTYHYAHANPTEAHHHYELALAALGEGGSPALLAEIWGERGRVLAQLADWPAAADAFARAVALSPENPDYAAQLHQINLILQELEQVTD